MKNTKLTKHLSLILSIVLIAAMALFTTGCENKDKEDKKTSSTQQSTDTNTVKELGEGETSFSFTVIDGEGNETSFKINTDKSTVGEALLENELIAGEEGDYGLYVKTVNGITADYDKDQTYWAFYVNGEYATSGVDQTKINESDSYSFKIQQ